MFGLCIERFNYMVTLESAVRDYLSYLHLRSEFYQTAFTLPDRTTAECVFHTVCPLVRNRSLH